MVAGAVAGAVASAVAGVVAGAGAVAAGGVVAGVVAGAVAGMVAGAVADAIGGTVAGAVGGAVVSAVDDAVFSDVYAVAAAVVFTINRSLILISEIEILPGDDILNAPRPNVERAPVRSNWLMERRETRNVGVYIASISEYDTLTRPWWQATTVDLSPSFMSMLSHSLWVRPWLPLEDSPCWWFQVPVRLVGRWSAILINVVWARNPAIAIAVVPVFCVFRGHCSLKL